MFVVCAVFLFSCFFFLLFLLSLFVLLFILYLLILFMFFGSDLGKDLLTLKLALGFLLETLRASLRADAYCTNYQQLPLLLLLEATPLPLFSSQPYSVAWRRSGHQHRHPCWLSRLSSALVNVTGHWRVFTRGRHLMAALVMFNSRLLHKPLFQLILLFHLKIRACF